MKQLKQTALSLLLSAAMVSPVFANANTNNWWLVPVATEAEDYSPAQANQIMGALHRLETDNHVLYLFGSVHAGREDWFPLAQPVQDAMARADVFALETDIFAATEEDLLALAEAFASFEFLPEGQTLAGLLPMDVYTGFVDVLAMFGMDYDQFYAMNPMVLQTMLLQHVLLPMVTELSWATSVDEHVFDIALANERPVLGLTPLYSELQDLFQLPDAAMIEVAEGTIVAAELWLDIVSEALSLEELREHPLVQELLWLEYFAEVYLVNDIEGMIDSMATAMFLYNEEPTPMESHMRYVLQFQRSIQFAQAIVELLETTEEPTTFFVTLGISHLLRGGHGFDGDGITNVIAYLRAAGFELEPVVLD